MNRYALAALAGFAIGTIAGIAAVTHRYGPMVVDLIDRDMHRTIGLNLNGSPGFGAPLQ